jgi:hypothetical protein
MQIEGLDLEKVILAIVTEKSQGLRELRAGLRKKYIIGDEAVTAAAMNLLKAKLLDASPKQFVGDGGEIPHSIYYFREDAKRVLTLLIEKPMSRAEIKQELESKLDQANFEESIQSMVKYELIKVDTGSVYSLP